MRIIFIAVACLLVTACGKEKGPAETRYNEKTIKVTSIYTNWKKDEKSAMEKAEKELDHFTHSACRETIAKGWSLVEVISTGDMNCEETPEGHHCRKKNIELKCHEVIAEFGS